MTQSLLVARGITSSEIRHDAIGGCEGICPFSSSSWGPCQSVRVCVNENCALFYLIGCFEGRKREGGKWKVNNNMESQFVRQSGVSGRRDKLGFLCPLSLSSFICFFLIEAFWRWIRLLGREKGGELADGMCEKGRHLYISNYRRKRWNKKKSQLI